MPSRFITGTCLALLLSGCFTAQLPAPPQASAPASGVTPIGVMKVQDLRTDQSVGTVGLAHFNLGPELDEYFYDALAARLTQAGYAVNEIGGPGKLPDRMKVVAVALVSVSIQSRDALGVPADAEARCEVKVLDPSGSQIYAQRYRGSLGERVDSESLNAMKATGSMAAKMLDQLADQIVKDPDFQKAIH